MKQLPKPGALVFALCHLDKPKVEEAVKKRYEIVLGTTDPAQIGPAATRFLNHEPEFLRLDVEAHETDPTQSNELGEATGGKLHVAAFTHKEGVTTYVNPLPYLAAVITPVSDLDSIAPVISSVTLQTSDTDDFAILDSFPADTGEPTVPRKRLRVAVRIDDKTSAVGPATVPYRFEYVLDRLTMSGATVASRQTVSRGVSLMNAVVFADAALLANRAYGTSPPTESLPGGPLWVHLPWDITHPPANEPAPRNALDPAGFSIDLARDVDGVPVFPDGLYELSMSIADIANPPVTRAVRFNVTGGSAPPGDSEITYTPASGPLGTEVVLAAATSNAFEDGRTIVEFTGTFDPAGLDADGIELGTTPSFTILYPVARVRFIDGNHVAVRIGDVKPTLAIVDGAVMRYGYPGKLSGSLRLRTDRADASVYEHVLATAGFTVTEASRFGLVVDGELQPIDGLPTIDATSPSDVLAAPDFERVVAEQRIPVSASATPPPTIDVRVRSLDGDGNFLDQEDHTMDLVGVVSGMAVYRSGHSGGRKLVFVDNAALSGEHGSDLLAVHVGSAGTVRLDGDPP